jgi:hypothetical protein
VQEEGCDVRSFRWLPSETDLRQGKEGKKRRDEYREEKEGEEEEKKEVKLS